MKKSLIFLIKVYRKIISPLKGRPTCIYTPTCSQYAIEALEKYEGEFFEYKTYIEMPPVCERWI